MVYANHLFRNKQRGNAAILVVIVLLFVILYFLKHQKDNDSNSARGRNTSGSTMSDSDKEILNSEMDLLKNIDADYEVTCSPIGGSSTSYQIQYQYDVYCHIINRNNFSCVCSHTIALEDGQEKKFSVTVAANSDEKYNVLIFRAAKPDLHINTILGTISARRSN